MYVCMYIYVEYLVFFKRARDLVGWPASENPLARASSTSLGTLDTPSSFE